MSVSNDRSKASPDAELRARVLAQISALPSPTRAERRSRSAVVLGAAVVTTLVLFLATGRLFVGERPAALVAFTALASALIGAVLVLVLRAGRGSVGSRGRSMLGGPWQLSAAVTGLAVVLLAALAVVAGVLWSDALASMHEEVSDRTHAACGALTVTQGALPLVLALLARRGTDPIQPALAGAAIGALVGTAAAAMAYLRCPHATVLHWLVAHVAPVIALVAVGALLGRALLKVREIR